MPAMNAHVDPLPFVPATCTMRRLSCGRPQALEQLFRTMQAQANVTPRALLQVHFRVEFFSHALVPFYNRFRCVALELGCARNRPSVFISALILK